jgi:serine/threonine protein kinase
VHRDVKPSNIMIAKDGRTLITDFGIARTVREAGARLTRDDKTVGTPHFMSPEQIAGEKVGSPSDVFSFGIVLYLLFTGVHPFGEGPWSAVIRRISEGGFAEPRSANPELTPGLSSLISRSLARKPRERFEDAGALGRALADS